MNYDKLKESHRIISIQLKRFSSSEHPCVTLIQIKKKHQYHPRSASLPLPLSIAAIQITTVLTSNKEVTFDCVSDLYKWNHLACALCV